MAAWRGHVPSPSSNLLDSARAEIVRDAVIRAWRACPICWVSWRHPDDHSFSCSCEQDPVLVENILTPDLIPDPLPFGPFEGVDTPAITLRHQIDVPADTRPVEFQSLDRKFCRRRFQIVRRANVRGRVQEPALNVKFHSYIEAIRTQTSAPATCDETNPPRSALPTFQPSPRVTDVSSEHQGKVRTGREHPSCICPASRAGPHRTASSSAPSKAAVSSMHCASRVRPDRSSSSARTKKARPNSGQRAATVLTARSASACRSIRPSRVALASAGSGSWGLAFEARSRRASASCFRSRRANNKTARSSPEQLQRQLDVAGIARRRADPAELRRADR